MKKYASAALMLAMAIGFVSCDNTKKPMEQSSQPREDVRDGDDRGHPRRDRDYDKKNDDDSRMKKNGGCGCNG